METRTASWSGSTASTARSSRTPEEASVNTATFVENDGGTTLTILVEHSNKEFRDAHINSGMEDGLQDAMELLEEVAASLK